MPVELTLVDTHRADPGDIAFSTQRGWQRFMLAGGLLGFSVLCSFAAEPRATGRVLAAVFLGASAISTITAGFVTQAVFSPGVGHVKITKGWLLWDTSCKDYEYSAVSLSLRSFARFTSTRGRGAGAGATPLLYVANVAGISYVLDIPSFYPASEARLNELRERYGFNETA